MGPRYGRAPPTAPAIGRSRPAPPPIAGDGAVPSATPGVPLPGRSGDVHMGLVAAPDLPFLLSESRATPMHVGGLQVFELPDGVG
ncbi:MAG: hypothetical protein KDA98_16975, partial [Acidimicrobiales bacterium]|nr:hypothetical protein [Acidimicrobiales bacterium]